MAQKRDIVARLVEKVNDQRYLHCHEIIFIKCEPYFCKMISIRKLQNHAMVE
jgi:hypothetical protein